jgi:hypothetical protein
MNKVLMITLCLLALSGCRKNKNAALVDIGMGIQYRDSMHTDLLDASESGSFKISEMKHYYLTESNEKVEVNLPNLDHPNEIFIYRDRDTMAYTLGVDPYTLNTKTGINILTDILDLSSTVSDTIQTEVYLSADNSLLQTQKIWYNRKLVWDGSGERRFVVVK